MAEADQLRIVFRLANLGLVMPVAQLMAIEEVCPAESFGVDGPEWVLAHFEFRGVNVPVYDLAAYLGLEGSSDADAGRVLIFSGGDQPWAIQVDRVEGVIDVTELEPLSLPAYLFAVEDVPYRQAALYQRELLVSFEAAQLEHALQEGR